MNKIFSIVVKATRHLAAAMGAYIAVLCPASAAVVIDQSSLVVGDPTIAGAMVATFGAFSPPGSPMIRTGYVQTFTAGATGYLDHLDLQIFSTSFPPESGVVTINVFDGDLIAGGATLVASASVAGESLPESGPFGGIPISFVTANVRTADFMLTAAQKFSATVGFVPDDGVGTITLAMGSIKIGADQRPIMIPNDYAGGELRFFSSAFAGFGAPASGDIGFRTFVDTVPLSGVPEVSSWALLLVGFGAVGTSLRRRRGGLAPLPIMQ